MNILEVRNLKKYFPIRKGLFYKTVGYIKAVDGINFSLEEGKTLGIVGESGSGKSTLARLLVRVLKPDEGEIFLKGKEITSLSLRELKSVSIVFQDPFSSLDPRFTVEKIVLEGMELLEKSNIEKKKKVLELLELVGLSKDVLDRFPHEFSGGQRQRISIARALAGEAELIILDEPVSSLDLSIQAQIINLLMDLQKKLHLSYVFIAHDLRVVRHVSDDICVVYRGKILEKADSEEIFKNPLHPYTRILFSAIPKIGTKKLATFTYNTVESIPKEKEGLCCFLSRCKEKKAICEEKEPLLKEISSGHWVCCWLAD
ncbi:MAG: ABC transporter ATP-binding protein [Candidatus Omnitrophota bacterium]